ncbi:MAG TPA: hypothetical protein VFP87_00600 [Chitinophagaceae bacterium]|nr:hypothetical protein [Chitinophagaceae bacterium]
MENEHSLSLNLEIDHATTENIYEGIKWTRFYAISLLSLIGLCLIFILLNGRKIASAFTELPNSESSRFVFEVVVIAVLIISAIVGLLMYFLLRGSKRIKIAIQTQDQLLLNNGLNDLKTYFVIYGVMAIIGVLGNLLTFIK